MKTTQLSDETRRRLSLDSQAVMDPNATADELASAYRANAILCASHYPDPSSIAVSMRILRGEDNIPECGLAETSLLACGLLD
jgi:hypothetical protein